MYNKLYKINIYIYYYRQVGIVDIDIISILGIYFNGNTRLASCHKHVGNIREIKLLILQINVILATV